MITREKIFIANCCFVCSTTSQRLLYYIITNILPLQHHLPFPLSQSPLFFFSPFFNNFGILESKIFHQLKPMITLRFNFVSFILKDSFYVLGGYIESEKEEDSIGEMYDIEADRWSYSPPIPLPVYCSCIAADQKFIYVFGKSKTNICLQIYDSEKRTWNVPSLVPEFVNIKDSSDYHYKKRIFIYFHLYFLSFCSIQIKQNLFFSKFKLQVTSCF